VKSDDAQSQLSAGLDSMLLKEYYDAIDHYDRAIALKPDFAQAYADRGGIEEPGWRGFLLPELQKRFNPLVASLIIAVIWDLWHIPLHINGFYSSGVVAGMARISLFIIPLAIFFTWVYNKSGGKLLVLVLLYTSLNVGYGIVPASFLPALVIGTIVVIVIVVKDKMYVKLFKTELFTNHTR